MLSDDDFYNSILDYLNEGAELDLSGTAILVDESTVNPDENTDYSDETTSTDLSESKEKLMYTVDIQHSRLSIMFSRSMKQSYVLIRGRTVSTLPKI